MYSTPAFASLATLPIVLPRRRRPRRERIDLLSIVQRELGRPNTPEVERELLGIAGALLRSRQKAQGQ